MKVNDRWRKTLEQEQSSGPTQFDTAKSHPTSTCPLPWTDGAGSLPDGSLGCNRRGPASQVCGGACGTCISQLQGAAQVGINTHKM